MKAITYNSYGPPDVLKIENIQSPQAGGDEFLVRVQAVEATKSDCEMRSFRFAVKWFWLPLRIAFGIRRPRRKVLGGYFSGELVSCPGGTRELAAGDAVFGSTGLGMGAYAEYLVVPASSTIARMPLNMSYAEAASVPLGGLNALHFMRLARVKPGDRLLIIGAGGSIGLHAIQIARAMGAKVTAVDSTIKENLCRRMGADRYIDYSREDFSVRGELYDVIFDMVPSSSYRACIKCLASSGTYLCGNPRLSVMLATLATNWFTGKTARFAFARETIEELESLKRMIEEGQVKSIVDRVLPMEQVAHAHALVDSEQRLGAIVIAVGDLASS